LNGSGNTKRKRRSEWSSTATAPHCAPCVEKKNTGAIIQKGKGGRKVKKRKGGFSQNANWPYGNPKCFKNKGNQASKNSGDFNWSLKPATVKGEAKTGHPVRACTGLQGIRDAPD